MAKASEQAIITKKFEHNVQLLEQELAVGTNFDVISRPYEFGGKKLNFFFCDGLINSNIFLLITKTLAAVHREDLAIHSFDKLVETYMTHVQTSIETDLHKIIDSVLAGRVAVVVENEARVILIEARSYPARGPEEPDLERVVRGSRDGFVETIIHNTALIRRRIRDPKLRTEMLSSGTRSKSDICVCYIEGIANSGLVEEIKGRINNIKIDGLPMAEKSVEELIAKGSQWNPFPQVRYTERPDVAAAHLLEGHVLIIVDTSPSIMIAPTTFFHHVQHAEEYRQAPLVGAYIRWVRFFAIISSLVILPMWLLVALEPGLLPKSLQFIGPAKIGKIPLVGQFVLAELGLDMLRMAAIHTPSPLTTALGLIAAFMIGDVAIKIGLFAPETIMYLAFAAVGTFATPSYEMGMALRLWRLLLVILVGAFRLPGLIGGLAALFILLATYKSFGVPYLWPLIPFNWKAFKAILVRYPVPITNSRPSILKPADRSRQPKGHSTVLSPARKPLDKRTDADYDAIFRDVTGQKNNKGGKGKDTSPDQKKPEK